MSNTCKLCNGFAHVINQPCDSCIGSYREQGRMCFHCTEIDSIAYRESGWLDYYGNPVEWLVCKTCYYKAEIKDGKLIRFACCDGCGECTDISLTNCEWCRYDLVKDDYGTGHPHAGNCWAGCA